jgi:hypothetical protein
MSDLYLELTQEEFIVIMAALEYTGSCSEIRTLYTDGSKSSELTGRANDIWHELKDERFDEIYDRYLDKYYATKEF